MAVCLGRCATRHVDSVLDWFRRHFEAHGLGAAKSGAVTVAQRVSSDLRLNRHFHTLVLDGAYAEDEQGELRFHSLSCVTNSDVADILQIACSRIQRLLRHKGVIEDDTVDAPDALTDTLIAPPALRRTDPPPIARGTAPGGSCRCEGKHSSSCPQIVNGCQCQVLRTRSAVHSLCRPPLAG